MELYHVDAFSDRPFAGNPAAVCILSEPRSEAWMQSVATEMSLPETAFLQKIGNGYQLRWFTPLNEEQLCGHATLASAHVLWETNRLGLDEEALFHTCSGVLTARKSGEWIELNFPIEREEEVPVPPGLSAALGIKPLYVGKNRLDYVVEVGSESDVRGVHPDYKSLASFGARGIIVTSRAESPDFDFVSRFFVADLKEEDPVTGSAHCCLAPFWKKRLGKEVFRAFQASKRGGKIAVEIRGERVLLRGQAFTVCRGDLRV